MTDTATDIDDGSIDAESEPDDGGADSKPGSGDESDHLETTTRSTEGRSPMAYLELAALAGLVALSAVAGIGFYTNTSSAIGQFISPSYEPVFQAAFNLALLLVALTGLSLLARRRFDLA